jgi:hypothetical protein
MKTSPFNGSLVQNVLVYTEDDMEFKKELLPLIVKNIKDLKCVIMLKVDRVTLKEAAHKFKTTITMVNDTVLMDCIEVLISRNQGTLADEAITRVAMIRCDHAIKELEEELTRLNDGVVTDPSTGRFSIFPISSLEN